VLLAVQFDHELRGMAVKIDNVSVDRRLPLEFRTLEA
jgi:hypothetical protein